MVDDGVEGSSYPWVEVVGAVAAYAAGVVDFAEFRFERVDEWFAGCEGLACGGGVVAVLLCPVVEFCEDGAEGLGEVALWFAEFDGERQSSFAWSEFLVFETG